MLIGGIDLAETKRKWLRKPLVEKEYIAESTHEHRRFDLIHSAI